MRRIGVLLAHLLSGSLCIVIPSAPDTGCSWTSPQGLLFDLTDLRNWTSDFAVDVEGFPAAINVCGPTIAQQCGPDSAACWFGPDANISLASSVVALFGSIGGNNAGRIYIVGGQNSTGGALSGVTMYDVATGVYAVQPSLPTPRINPGASVLANGQMYAFGGSTDDIDALGTLDAYSVLDATWSSLPPMSSTRMNLGWASVGTTIFAVSGWGGDSFQQWTLPTAEMFQPANGTWQPMSNIPSPRQSLSVVAVGGNLFAAGGLAAPPQDVSGAFETYNIALNTWSSLPSLPTARQGLACAAVGLFIYCAGGDDALGHVFNVVEVYNLASTSWSTVAPMPAPRTNLAMVGVQWPPALYAFGGSDGTGPTDTLFIYNVTANTWSTGAPLAQPIEGHAAVAVGPDAGVSVQYFAGQDDRAVELQMVCDPSADAGTPVFVEERPPGHFAFYWLTAFGCPPPFRYPHTVLDVVQLATSYAFTVHWVDTTQQVWAIVDGGFNMSCVLQSQLGAFARSVFLVIDHAVAHMPCVVHCSMCAKRGARAMFEQFW
eukprot:TRINITY_DN3387_c0_g1_i4.p1 TRINITY_DN3387_c0_g1~~TRINITY_DN3387_c0_g1_i4.p1  ORF type:complete len:545 (+),score=144.28 TRINITY_DN3387_c0_g1_i4:111-1745(+)